MPQIHSDHQPHHHSHYEPHEHHHDHHQRADGDEQLPARPSRRHLLKGLGAMGLAAAAARPSLADLLKPVAWTPLRQTSSASALFRIERVAEGIYAAIAKPAAMLNCNAAVIVGSDHVLVVDSHSKPSAARALMAQIRAEITDRPVRYVVDSHFHWDHAQGNLAYPEAFGAGTQIISSTATREWLAREGVPRLRQSLESLPKQIADARTQLAAAKTAAEREHLGRQVTELESYLKEMTPPEKQIALPTVTFDHRLIIHHGGREVHLIFLGRGHTAGDVVLYVPSERVVATGDLMHGVLPYIGDGYPDEWPRTLTELEKIDFDRVVPGHGLVQQGKSVLAFFRSYVEELNEAVARGVERGSALVELQRALAPERLRSLQLSGQQERVAREAAVLLGPLPDPAALLKGAVATNVAEVYNYYTKRKGRQ